MPGRVRRMTSREAERILRDYGFALVSQRGSHRKWYKEDSGNQVVVPEHAGRTLPIGTLRDIMQNAEIPGDEWHD